jgi:hypothetical protein
MLQTTSRESLEPPSTPQSLASWYAPGVSDGLGDRLLMFDNSAAPSLELLRFRPDLADSPGFEAALRQQVQRLSRFQHPAFARVRSVQRLEPDGDLALVSNHTPGKRLSEILHRAHGPAFAAAMIRQLAPALADLQRQHPGAVHGLLSPERIVVSPEARLTIVEHVIGPAIESAGLGPGELALRGITVPPGRGGGLLQPATDWFQLGLIALSVALGRPVDPVDLPQLEALVGEAADAADRDAAGVAPFLRTWLERSLQISGEGIASGADARALSTRLSDGGFSDRSRVLPMRTPRLRTQAVQTPEPATAPEVIAAAADPVVPSSPGAVAESREVPRPHPSEASRQVVLEPAVARLTAPLRPVFTHDSVAPSPSAVQELSPFEREVLAGRIVDRSVSLPVAHGVAAPSKRFQIAAGVALLQGLVLAWIAGSAWVAEPPAFGLQASASGEHVLTHNGQPSGGPVALAVGPDLSWVRLTSSPAIVVAGAKPESGTLRISSPLPMEVKEGGRTLGSIPGPDLKLAPGRHELELVNDAVEFRQLQVLEITGGEGVLLQIAPRPGAMTVEATVGTEITIDGRSIGRTPLAPVSLVPGEYQVALRYARGAPDRQRVIVKSDATTHVVAKPR